MEEINGLRRLGHEIKNQKDEILYFTVSADILGGEIPQEILDENAGEYYVSATSNEDGSITCKVTGKQHRYWKRRTARIINELLQELVEDDTFSISEIKHNEDYTCFDITMDEEAAGLKELILQSDLFMMYADIYGSVSGNRPKEVTLNFYSASGEQLHSMKAIRETEDPVLKAIMKACQVCEEDCEDFE